jgi:hypothetical protein
MFHETFRELERVRKKDPMHPSPAVHLPNRCSDIHIERLCALTRHAVLHHVDVGQYCTYHEKQHALATLNHSQLQLFLWTAIDRRHCSHGVAIKVRQREIS